eukprot:321130_1
MKAFSRRHIISLLSLFLIANSAPTCERNAYLDYGNGLYWQNNEWGSSKALNSSWQCAEILNYGTNNQQAKLTYNWLTNTTSNHSVKAYPHLGLFHNNTNQYGLPIKISDNISCISSWTTYHKTLNKSKEDRFDNAYDIWITNTSDRDGKHAVEIMIWLAYTHPLTGQLIDSNVTFPSWGDLIFDVYYAIWDHHDFPSYSFFCKSNNGYTWNISNVDINEMFQYLYKRNYIHGDQYIADINAGVEISDGNGEFIYEYNLTIKH